VKKVDGLMDFSIEGNLVRLRPIRISDVTNRYVEWFASETAEFIEFGHDTVTIERLSMYVSEKILDDRVLMLAILDIENGVHIGNLKLEPFAPEEGVSDLGVFIGEPAYLGRGFGVDAIAATLGFLRGVTFVRTVSLGVDSLNHRALVAYRKLGFVEIGPPFSVEGPGGSRYEEVRMKIDLA